MNRNKAQERRCQNVWIRNGDGRNDRRMDPNGFSDEEKEEGVYEHSYYGYTHMEIHLVVVNQFFSALVARCYHFQMRQHPTDKLTLTSIRHLKNKDGEQNDRLHRKSKVK